MANVPDDLLAPAVECSHLRLTIDLHRNPIPSHRCGRIFRDAHQQHVARGDKGFALLTPYAGIGRVHVASKPTGVAALGLRKESFDLDKVYAGLNINLGLTRVAAA